MLRSKAIATLLLLLLLPLCLPLVPPKGESSLPACCRGNGKHRCSVKRLRATVQDHAAPTVQTAGEVCPHRSLLFGATASCAVAVPSRAMYAIRPLTRSSAILQTVLRAGVAEARNHHKRGPPFLLA